MAEAELIVASNRGPLAFAPGGVSARRGSGGLVSALRPVMEGGRGRWIAAAMTPGDRDFAASARPVAETDGASYSLTYLLFDDADFARAYDVISNGLLWSAAHGLFDSSRRPVIDSETYDAWRAYREFNRRFAEAVAASLEEVSTGATQPVVLIQDYHLYLVPAMLREIAPPCRIGFFLHTPFPAEESLAHLPGEWVREIVSGVLAADLVAFHSHRWARRFEDASRTFGLDASGVTGVFPLGPDPATLLAEASTAEVEAAVAARGVADDELLVLRVDRVEPAKNTLRGFMAIDELLETTPELRGRLRHLALLHPSRGAMAEYRKYEADCLALADTINQRRGGSDWQPITVDLADSYPRSLAAMKRYDVLLVNSIADGMNLVAREGPLVNERDGALVLSSMTGAAEVLADAAFLVNPFDVSETAGAIARAISLRDRERRERAAVLRESAGGDPPAEWLDAQLERLTRG